jgi:IS5 family transposase
MLSVSGKPEDKKKSARLFKGLIATAFLSFAVMATGVAMAAEYGSYEESGSPELDKLVWNDRASTYGIWTTPPKRIERPAVHRARASAPRTEAGCQDCAVAGAASTRQTKVAKLTETGREIEKAAAKKAPPKTKTAPKKVAKRTAEQEAEEESEYDAIEEEKTAPDEKSSKTQAPGKFVDKLLKNAHAEASRSCRSTSRGTRCKGSIGKGLGMCLQGVRMALQKTKGVSLGQNIGTDLAKNAGPHLKKFGYTKASSKVTQANAPLGAIMIYNAPGQPNKAGHIEIKGKNGYYSDYFNSKPLNELMPGRRQLIGIYLPPKN